MGVRAQMATTIRFMEAGILKQLALPADLRKARAVISVAPADVARQHPAPGLRLLVLYPRNRCSNDGAEAGRDSHVKRARQESICEM